MKNTHLAEVRAINDHLRLIATEQGGRFFSPVDLLCKDDNCLISVGTDGRPVPIVYDYGHWTAEGSVFVVKNGKFLAE